MIVYARTCLCSCHSHPDGSSLQNVSKMATKVNTEDTNVRSIILKYLGEMKEGKIAGRCVWGRAGRVANYEMMWLVLNGIKY